MYEGTFLVAVATAYVLAVNALAAYLVLQNALAAYLVLQMVQLRERLATQAHHLASLEPAVERMARVGAFALDAGNETLKSPRTKDDAP